MIDFKAETMRLETSHFERIDKWVVWFRTVEGLFTTLPQAVASAESCGMDVRMIQPVTIALDAQGHYEECIR